ncbi:methyltransferase domain-containing protein [Paenibacillus camelliae]|uniref:methyltransferase domain-containing protein n=1 Tax=Paenibacillus camelliae TaxID=512410 RepID=UPI00203ABB9B|nr:methyltransferase domain-containing protein [Paenibacillus camelliae]MCM3632829.1 methyltransferase domain-containing protein [Paenibacillus camelliae]
MFKKLRHRALEDELMDDFSMGGAELREALQQLRVINRIFQAAGPVKYGVQQLWQEAGKPDHLSILDIGAGSGDVNRLLLRWASANGIEIKLTLADRTEEACEEAKQLFRDEPRVEVLQCNLYDLQTDSFDIVTGSQFVHHFSPDELPSVVGSMLHASRTGVVINDIHRHWIPWLAVWLTARLISTNRYIRNDAPLSVAKGFRSEDWRHLKAALGAPDMAYCWRPLFRYAVIIKK